jgi:hypothetical protein
LNTNNKGQYLTSGVYQLTCPDFDKWYVGQTGINFARAFEKHLLSFKNHSNSSRFALHLRENDYPFGKVENIMKILSLNTKGSYMDIIEKFQSYIEIVSDRQLNDKDAVTLNQIFETVIKDENRNTHV